MAKRLLIISINNIIHMKKNCNKNGELPTENDNFLTISKI